MCRTLFRSALVASGGPARHRSAVARSAVDPAVILVCDVAIRVVPALVTSHQRSRKCQAGDASSDGCRAPNDTHAARMPRVILNVAEKSSVAKAIAGVLGGGRAQARGGVRGHSVWVFDFDLPGFGAVEMHVTCVRGHLKELEFTPEFRCVSRHAPSCRLERRAGTFPRRPFALCGLAGAGTSATPSSCLTRQLRRLSQTA